MSTPNLIDQKPVPKSRMKNIMDLIELGLLWSNQQIGEITVIYFSYHFYTVLTFHCLSLTFDYLQVS